MLSICDREDRVAGIRIESPSIIPIASNWTDPIASLKTLLSAEWIKETLNECFKIVSVDLQPYGDVIAGEVSGALAMIKTCTVIFVVFTFVGLVGGYYLTRFLVRRNIAKRGLRKFIVATLADALITTGIQIGCVWLYTVWKPSVFVTTLLSLSLFTFVSLFEAYLVHGRGKVKMKQILTAKNGVFLILTDFIIFYFSIALLFGAVAITNVIAGIFIGFAFVEIAFIVITLNAESYVIKYISEEQNPAAAAEEKGT